MLASVFKHRYSNPATRLPPPQWTTRAVLIECKACTTKLYRPGYAFQKIGNRLIDTANKDFFFRLTYFKASSKTDKLMKLLIW
jgi:hypothetical protein